VAYSSLSEEQSVTGISWGTYGMTQPQCNEWIHRLSDILLKILKAFGEFPDRNHLWVRFLTNVKMFFLMEKKGR
jgi:hypothetical protein